MSEHKHAVSDRSHAVPVDGRQFDVLALGELLIDFTMHLPVAAPLDNRGDSVSRSPGGIPSAVTPSLRGDAGGAPANVLAAVARLGGRAGFIGKVGRDAFGWFLASTLHSYGIDTTGLKESSEVLTTLAFVSLTADGERSFTFNRNPGADTQLSLDDVDLRRLGQTRVFHFGSLSLTHEPSRSTTLAAAKAAKEAGCTVTFDPNWRPPLWDSEEQAMSQMLQGIKSAHIVKVSAEELTLLTGAEDIEQGAMALIDKGPELILVTLGSEGCFYATRQDMTGLVPSSGLVPATGLVHSTGLVPSIPVHAVDTTGAGDAFVGGFLWKLTRGSNPSWQSWQRDELEDAIRFANVVGALTASRSGTMSAMPSLEQVVSMLG